MDGRLENLELALGVSQPGDNDEYDQEVRGSVVDGLLERVKKLESLTRMTQARSCYQLQQLGLTSSGHYFIDPDGVGVGQGPVRVWCDMRSGHTRVSHQWQGEDSVNIVKCREPGCSVHSVEYEIPMRQIQALLLISGQGRFKKYLRKFMKGILCIKRHLIRIQLFLKPSVSVNSM